MEAKELRSRNGWITCPKDKCVTLVDHHCRVTQEKKCAHFKGRGKQDSDLVATIYCTYEAPTDKEESQ